MITERSSIQEQFADNGFVLAKSVFQGKILEEMTRDFDRIIDQLTASREYLNAKWSGKQMESLDAKDTVVIHTHNVQQYSSTWMRALMHEPFLDVCRQLLGEDVILHHTKLFQKPSENGAPFPMHQDWGYFPTLLNTMLAGVIHVSNANDEMGCLRVFPGSHKLGRLNEAMGGENLEDYPIDQATPIEAEPGDVVFFHYLTIHGSLPNKSNQVRKTVLVQMHSGQDQVEPGNLHPNESLVLSGWNYKMSRTKVTS